MSISNISIGQEVIHPQFGTGHIMALYRQGTEWLVRFNNGLRLRRPHHEFQNQTSQTILPTTITHPQFTPPPPTPTDQLEARHLIEALRMGIAPAQYIHQLTINLQEERASLDTALTQAVNLGGAVRAVIGEYGYGKSHLVELTHHQALQRNFLVARISLDLLELPPHRAFDIYNQAMHSLTYPDTDESGLGPLLNQTADLTRIWPQLHELSPFEHDPLILGLRAIANTASSRRRKIWTQWLMGARSRTYAMTKEIPKNVKFPTIYKNGKNARQIAYLFTGISTLARLAGYQGLCLLIDEAESYSLLRAYQRPKANQFFQAMIYATLRHHQSKLDPSQFPQHRYRDYPLAYDNGQSILFLFTVTHSDNRLPLHDWLNPDQILTLTPNVPPQELSQFLATVLVYHQQAYNYTADERQGQLKRAAAEIIAQSVRHGRLAIRQVVRLAVELFDLLYLHPDYDAATLIEELRQNI
ncbi:MAG TPA: BREX system ATP-binding domain-containing protein [Anaerolineae bacterium]|nr:BREX system ATP-binding domain-containing protein [Anaerolineae bacterium]